jgi:hypothetical protein
MQISCHAPPIVYIFILLNYEKFPGTTSFFLCVKFRSNVKSNYRLQIV